MKPLVVTSILLLFAWSNTLQAQRVKTLEFKAFEIPKEGAVKHRAKADTSKSDSASKASLAMIKKEFKAYNSKGQMTKYQLFSLNPAGQLIKMNQRLKEWLDEGYSEEVFKYDQMGDLVSRVKTIYNDKKKPKKVEVEEPLKNPGQIYTKIYEYGKNGLIDKITWNDKSGKKVGEEQWKYNRDDEEVLYKKTLDKPNGKYQEVKKTDYNKDGSLASSEKSIKDGDDKYEEIVTFERNRIKEKLKYKNGELVSEFGGGRGGGYDPSKARVLVDFTKDDGGSRGGFGGGGFGMWTNEDEFDDNGNKIKSVQKVDDKITQVTTFKYDHRDNLTYKKIVSFDEEGNKSTIEEEKIEYDKYNNTLKKSVYKNDVLILEDTYDYTYY